MAIEPRAFLTTMETRIGLTAEDKKVMQSNTDW
jgi:hypothetical protein